MARHSELTQSMIDEAADQLRSLGKKPSPNTVREIVGKGSFSTIKQMLDVWIEKQEENEKVPVPDVPEFAYRLLDKLHRELYLQNHKALEGERQLLEASRQEFETERKEMLSEIDNLERRNSEQEQSLASTQEQLKSTSKKLTSIEVKLEASQTEANTQKIELATLTEREAQFIRQLTEKDLLLVQAEKREGSLQQALIKTPK